MNTSDKTVAQTLQEAADARKGGYNDTASAMVGVSFGMINPENIFKQSNSDKHALQGGVIFMPSFSSYDMFEGDMEFSSLKKMLARLESKRLQHQRAINSKFLLDKVRCAKTHVVCSFVHTEAGVFPIHGISPVTYPILQDDVGSRSVSSGCLDEVPHV